MENKKYEFTGETKVFLGMNHNKRLVTCRAMKTYGGDFVQALGQALLRADAENAAIIQSAFQPKYPKYFPGGTMFVAAEKEMAEEV